MANNIVAVNMDDWHSAADGPMQMMRKEQQKQQLMKTQQKLAEEAENGKDVGWYEFPLPKPPLPELRHTLDRYLEYASVLAQAYGLDLLHTIKCVQRFEPIGHKVQQKLRQLADTEENWINRFWLSEMYLRQRMPLPLNFNPAYIFPRRQFRSEKDQLNYTALLVRGFLDFKQRVDKKQIVRETAPDRFSGPGCTVRMCMDQYERILNFYREPHADEDILHDRRRNKIKCQQTKLRWNNDVVVGGGGEGIQQNGQTRKDEEEEEAKNVVVADGRDEEKEEDEHILVLSDNQTFVLFTRFNGLSLPAAQLAQQLAKIRAMSRNRNGQTVSAIGGAGMGGRERAACFWLEMNKEPANQRSLCWVRTAVFVLCLDNNDDDDDDGEEQQEGEGNDDKHKEDKEKKRNQADDTTTLLNGRQQNGIERMERDGMEILHGNGPTRNGLNRWFDATIQLIVGRNGCCGLCIEHSVAEGIVYINMAESVIRYANREFCRIRREDKNDKEEVHLQEDLMPKCEKNVTETVSHQMPPPPMMQSGNVVPEPSPLSWRISEEASALLREQIAEFEQLSGDIQLRVLDFLEFGKDAIKRWRISPDGFVQLSMQLAHFKLHGHLVSTYESATMRRFRLGRVDNIRAATPEALEWVKAMVIPTPAAENWNVVGKEEEMRRKRALFAAAAIKQATITRENVTGHGIDNHLCALEVLCREEEAVGTDELELFHEPMWTQMMRFPLSTSQVSTSPDFQPGCYLCYGPVVRDGYGCAYNIQSGKIIFAISAWNSDARTNADVFREKLRDSLLDMRQMLEWKSE